MTSATEYENQIENLGIDGLEMSVSTAAEAKTLLAQCREKQKELHQIKKMINFEIKTIRANFKESITNAGAVTGGVFSVFGKRGIAGNIRAEAKRGMTRRRDSALSPYDDIKLYIDNLVLSLDSAKLKLQNYIAENKVEKNIKSKPSNESGLFCTGCGCKVDKTHKFCSQCGGSL
ncbi:hypothetical protein [Oceanicoccus sp. KOV_DT_Chl]|uniref:hypothetical protein n=1 Tax=Oceanicoccus sp. KOV_DT_Chl TaxID=1904639 RepID=UPI000C79AE37|nr:hypothetical protein [Oceanicoccus sp. KOV_DT_Chl]